MGRKDAKKAETKIEHEALRESLDFIGDDSWYPYEEMNPVTLTIYAQPLYGGRYIVRVVARPKDQWHSVTYVELRYETNSALSAKRRYDFWKKYIYDKVPDDLLSIEWFFEHGFIPDT